MEEPLFVTDNLDWTLTQAGLQLASRLPRLPLASGSPEVGQPEIRLLEELWGRNLYELTEECGLLPWMSIYELDPHERELLGLPEPSPNLKATVKTDRWITNPDFSIWPELWYYGNRIPDTPTTPRHGLLIKNMDEYLIPPREVGKLLLVLNKPIPKSRHERGVLIGEIQRIAAKSSRNIELDHFLKNEDYVLPERLGIDVEPVGSNKIRLQATIEGVDADKFRGFKEGPSRTSYTQFLPEGKRRRIILQSKQQEAIQHIRDKGILDGADVPEFFDNPEAFLPDEIKFDQSEFSQRVRGLAPIVYHSHPYIAVSETIHRGWFDAWPKIEVSKQEYSFDPEEDGARGESVSASEQIPELTIGDFRRLAAKAAETGGRYVKFRDGWIEIDHKRAQSVLDFCDQNPEMDNEGRRQVDTNRMKLVLDVIPNTDVLEYVEPDFGDGDFSGLQEYSLPESLVASLHPHQEIGYRWMRYLHSSKWGGLLADDMGLGKTVQLIALMSYLHDLGQLRPALLVVPLSVIVNWQRELKRFAPSIVNVHEHRGPKRGRYPDHLAQNEVVITTYATLRRDQIMLGKINWTMIACDEAQNVKNPTANVTSALKGMKSSFRVACTGTPVENGLSELWCIVDFVQPGRLGSQREFRDTYERPLVDSLHDTKDQEEHVVQLRSRLRPHYIRRIKEDVLDLPSKSDRVYHMSMSEKQASFYEDELSSLRQGVQHPLAALTRLIGICSHPLATEKILQLPDAECLLEDAPKLRRTIEILEGIQKLGAKAVIYTRLKVMQRILQRVVLDRFDFDPIVLNGEVSGHNRHRIVEMFNSGPGFDTLILSPEAAGVGLNITGATHVIHYTRLWNPAKENQATDRVYRIGQKYPVTVHYPVVVGDGFKSVEQHLDDLLKEKLQLARNVLVPKKGLDFANELERRVIDDPYLS